MPTAPSGSTSGDEGEQSQRTAGFPGYALPRPLRPRPPGVERTSIYSSNGRRSPTWRPEGPLLAEAHRRRVLEDPRLRLRRGRPVHRRRRGEPQLRGGDQRDHPRALLRRRAGRRPHDRGRRSALPGGRGRPDVPFLRFVPFADVWVPISTRKSTGPTASSSASFQALCLAESRAALPLSARSSPSGSRERGAPDPKVPDHPRRAETLFEPSPGCFFSSGWTRRARGCSRGFLAGRGGAVHAAAGGQPGQPQPLADPGADLGDRRAQGLRRLVADPRRPVPGRERGPDPAGRRLRAGVLAAAGAPGGSNASGSSPTRSSV
jgi:hypothetical protein